MKRFFLVVILLSNSVFSQNSLSDLKQNIDSAFASVDGEFAIAFKGLSHNDSLFINAREEFHAASTMKTPVMIEVFKQASRGKFSLDDSLLVKNEFKSIVDGSSFSLDIDRDGGEQLYDQIGKRRSIRDLVTDMIIYSSNLATNLVIQKVGAKNVTQSMREMGAKDIKILRGVEDMKAYEAGLSNHTTAYDLMLIFEHLAKGKAVSKEADQEMVNILMQQTHRDLIPALLPSNIKVANKTGMISGVHHDSAIVYLPDGRKYVLILLSKNMEDMDLGTKMLAEVSRMVYDYISVE